MTLVYYSTRIPIIQGISGRAEILLSTVEPSLCHHFVEGSRSCCTLVSIPPHRPQLTVDVPHSGDCRGREEERPQIPQTQYCTNPTPTTYSPSLPPQTKNDGDSIAATSRSSSSSKNNSKGNINNNYCYCYLCSCFCYDNYSTTTTSGILLLPTLNPLTSGSCLEGP